MPRPPAVPRPAPDWVGLMADARGRAGYFTAREAKEHGISSQLLRYRVHQGTVEYELHGVYRFVAAPLTEQDEYIALWLWSGERGVFSHDTALALHDLSDAMPARLHMTVPRSWRGPRTTKPAHARLHPGSLPEDAVQWLGSIPVTTPLQTIRDCIAAHASPEWIEQAIEQATRRGMISAGEAALLQHERRGDAPWPGPTRPPPRSRPRSKRS